MRILGLRSFIESCVRLAKLIGRPEPKELWLSVRISLIGLVILGMLGFIIKFLATMFQATPPTV